MRIVCTATPRSPRAWKNTGTPEGMRKKAEPSASTGTVPNTNFPGSSFETPRLGWFICGCTFGGTATKRSALTEPRGTPSSPR